MTQQSEDGTRLVRLQSAGGVVLRRTDDGHLETVLCGHVAESRWVLPKGGPEAGENLTQTALREVEEETGLKVEIGPKIGENKYSYYRWRAAVRYDQTVHFFLMSPVGGDTSLHDHEFDQVEWFETSEAGQRLTYKNEARILEKAVAIATGDASGKAGYSPAG
ncbi:MAG: NUDIX domain-containing protein [Dehalococcoidia bacterium]